MGSITLPIGSQKFETCPDWGANKIGPSNLLFTDDPSLPLELAGCWWPTSAVGCLATYMVRSHGEEVLQKIRRTPRYSSPKLCNSFFVNLFPVSGLVYVRVGSWTAMA